MSDVLKEIGGYLLLVTAIFAAPWIASALG